jgi:hypothetical protein
MKTKPSPVDAHPATAERFCSEPRVVRFHVVFSDQQNSGCFLIADIEAHEVPCKFLDLALHSVNQMTTVIGHLAVTIDQFTSLSETVSPE